MPRPRSGPNRRYSSYTREYNKLKDFHAKGCENVGKEVPEKCLSELCKTKRR